MISTARGEVPVELLQVGDLVQTRDNGLQPVRWIGNRTVGLAELIAKPRLQPVRIARGALGDGLPVRDTLVSPQHRMLFCGPTPEMLFGEAEVFVAVTHLTQLDTVEAVKRREVIYIHLLLDQHDIILALSLIHI